MLCIPDRPPRTQEHPNAVAGLKTWGNSAIAPAVLWQGPTAGWIQSSMLGIMASRP